MFDAVLELATTIQAATTTMNMTTGDGDYRDAVSSGKLTGVVTATVAAAASLSLMMVVQGIIISVAASLQPVMCCCLLTAPHSRTACTLLLGHHLSPFTAVLLSSLCTPLYVTTTPSLSLLTSSFSSHMHQHPFCWPFGTMHPPPPTYSQCRHWHRPQARVSPLYEHRRSCIAAWHRASASDEDDVKWRRRVSIH